MASTVNNWSLLVSECELDFDYELIGRSLEVVVSVKVSECGVNSSLIIYQMGGHWKWW